MEMTSPIKAQGQLPSESLSSWLPQFNTGEHGLKVSFLSAATTQLKRTFIQPDVTDNDRYPVEIELERPPWTAVKVQVCVLKCLEFTSHEPASGLKLTIATQ
jgi:hypothetical protein